MNGIIVKNISNDYTVECNGVYYTCKPRGLFRINGNTPLVGDEVVILGKSANKQITLQDYAKILNTSPYEILLNFNFKRMQYIIKKL